jgi:hypothetical protein
MAVAVRCEAHRRRGRCRNEAAIIRRAKGQPYLLCTTHARMRTRSLHLEAPLGFEGVQRAYREAHPRARDGA